MAFCYVTQLPGCCLPDPSCFPHCLKNVGFLFLKFAVPGKVLENEFDTGKSWKLNFEVLESPGIYLWFKLTTGTEKLLPVQNTMCK